MKQIIVLLFSIILSGDLFSFPQPSVHYLSNGSTVVVVVDPSAKISSSYVFVKTGSIFEDEVIGSGVSHYLEHLLSGGTTKFKSEDEYRDIIDELGGASNAYTTYNHTAYYIHTSSKNINRALQTLYEWTVYGDWTEAELNRERGVIHKEMERAASNIDRNVFQNVQALFYQGSPYQYPILGKMEMFNQLTNEKLHHYYETRYVPENFVIVVGGDVSKNAVLSYVKNTFGKEPFTSRKNQYNSNQKRILSESNSLIVIPELKTKRIVLRYPTVSFYENDVYPLDLLAYILGNGQQSLLYKEFVTKKKLATNISVRSITPSNEYGYFEIYIETDSDSQLIISEIKTYLQKIKLLGFKKKQIEAAVTQKRNEYILSNTSLSNYLRDIGQSMMMGNNPLFFSFYSNNFEEVTNKQLKKAMADYLKESKCQVYEFDKKEELISEDYQNSSQSIEVETFKEGVDIIYLPESNTDIVKITVHLVGGLLNETTDTNGIGYFASNLIGKSTRNMSRSKYQKLFETKGATIGATFKHNSLSYSFKSTQEDSKRLIPYFLKGITQFKIENDVYDEVRTQVLQSIKQKNEDWFEDSFDIFKSEMFSSKSNFSMPLKGSPEVINQLNKESLKAYVKNQLDQSEIKVLVHAKNPKQYQSIIENELKSLKGRTSKKNDIDFTFDHTEVATKIEQNVGVVMASVPVGQIESLNEYIKFQLIDAILSGMRFPSGLLHKRLRGKKLVYVVHALPLRFVDQDYLFIYALTSPPEVDNVKNIIFQSIQDMQSNITNEQFQLAKSQVLFSQQNAMQKINSKSREVVSQLMRFDKVVNNEEYEQALNKISIDELRETITNVFSNSTKYVLFNAAEKISSN